MTVTSSIDPLKARRLRIARRLRKELEAASEAPISQVANDLDEPLHLVVAVAQEMIAHDFTKTPPPYAQ